MKTIDKYIKFKPLAANQDELIFGNPDRGFRTEFVMFLVEKPEEDKQYDARTVFASETDEQINARLDSIFEIYFKENVS